MIETMIPTAASKPVLSPDVITMMKKRGLREWNLTVADANPVTPHMRRIGLTADNLDDFAYKAGQDLILMLPDGVAFGRRHYTIRRFDCDARRINIDVVLHGEAAPGTRWALGAKPGSQVLAFGPRGRNVLGAGANWRLFVGDETCIPAIFAMLETLPARSPAHAIIEVASDDDRQPLSVPTDVTIDWISRNGRRAEPSSPALIERLAAYRLPPGDGHVYVLGETSTIRRQRHDLLARGLRKEQIFGEGYWRPGRMGGHDHLEEY